MVRNLFGVCLAFLLLRCGNKPLEIPVRYSTHLLMNCTFNDSIKGDFMFDTGAYGLYLDSTYNATSKINWFPYYEPPEDETFDKIAQLNQPKPKKIVLTDPMELYLPEFTNIINLKSSFGKQFDGIVGWDLFKDKLVEIDYVNKKILISEPEDLDIDSSFTEIPLAENKYGLYLVMETCPSKGLKIKGRYLFDLGYGGAVLYTGDTYRQYRMDTVQTKRVTLSEDWGLFKIARSTRGIFRGHSMRLANFEINEPIMEYATDSTGVLGKGDYIALIGNRYFEQYRTIINLRAKILYLKPNKNFRKRMTSRNIGFGFVDRTDICDGFIVNSIIDNSDADKAGVRSGDIVTHLNGKRVNKDSEKMADLFYENEKEVKAITFRRGDSVYVLKVRIKKEF